MRIAQVCRIGWPHIGGMETVMGGLSAALVDRGHEVTAFTLDEALDDGTQLVDETIRGVPYRRLPRSGPARYPSARGLVDAVRGFDVVHVHGLDGLADTLVRTRGKHGAKVGVSTHGGFFHTTRLGWLKQLWLRTVTRRTLGSADAVWFTSESDRQVLAAAGVDGELLPDGVDVARFSAISRAPEVGRWLVPGRVEGHKGILDLLHLLARTPNTGRVELDVVGPMRDAAVEAELRDAATHLGLGGRVHLMGQVDDATYESHFARCELALFPSRYEGFGVAVVEAMAAGVPVVVSPIDAFAELVQPGADGHVLDFCADEAAEQLSALYGADHSAVGQAARASARRHSWEARVEDYERAYLAMVGP
ncbi:MAG: glycosyltransferase family 1 protein [Deltaproteobacteria bacterium]|nr:MAG: glycosyltransferase family 1 protein [Deltaproteobacteria bacterium]